MKQPKSYLEMVEERFKSMRWILVFLLALGLLAMAFAVTSDAHDLDELATQCPKPEIEQTARLSEQLATCLAVAVRCGTDQAASAIDRASDHDELQACRARSGVLPHGSIAKGLW